MTRDECIDLMWKKAEPNLYIAKHEFVANLIGWDIYDVTKNGMLYLLIARKGPEIHFQAFGRPITRQMIRNVVQPALDEHGYCVTKTPHEELRQQRFNDVIGFRVTGRDEYDVHYRVDADPGLRI
jgi:hypothetical protein